MEHEPDGLEPVEQTRCPELCDKGETHTRKSKCQSRCHVKDAASHIDRVVNSSRSSDSSVGTVGHSHGGPLRNMSESQVGKVCVSSAWVQEFSNFTEFQ